MSDAADWVLVEDEDELQVGTLTRFLHCPCCHEDCERRLLERWAAEPDSVNQRGVRTRSSAKWAWVCSTNCQAQPPSQTVVFDTAITARRLQRLAAVDSTLRILQ
jgi:hypothetical protein